MTYKNVLLVLMLTLFCGACLTADGAGGSKLNKKARTKLNDAIEALSAGDFQESNKLFTELKSEQEIACDVDYGLSLGGVLQLVKEVDELLDLVKLLAGNQQALPAQAGIDPDVLLDSFLGPFEKAFSVIREPGERVVENHCDFLLPKGLPIVLTIVVPDANPAPNSGGLEFVDFSGRIGYDFDTGFMRGLLAGVDSVQALIDFVLAHRFALEENFDEAIKVLTNADKALQQSSEDIDKGTIAQTERQTWVSVARSAGVIFDLNPNLLGLRDGGRMDAVDDDIERVARNLFFRNANGSESGLVVDLLNRGASDSLTDNVLAIVDVDRNNQINGGDKIVLGLREADVQGQISFGELSDGITITIPNDIGDIAEALRLVHEMLQNLGNQMEAVEDGSVDYVRFGISDFNQIEKVLDLQFEPVPEVAEFDLRAYFADPIPVRGLLPFWYDDGVDDFDVFLIEGESKVATTAESYVTDVDSAHFPDTITIGSINEINPIVIENLSIDADGLFAGDANFITPFPYIAFQSPSFGELLYLNSQAFPIAPEGSNAFLIADQYTINKVVNSLGLYYQDAVRNFTGD